MTRRGMLLSGLALAACGPRPGVTLDPAAASVGAVQTLFVASARVPLANGIDYSGTPSRSLGFSQVEVSVPPDRTVGTVTTARGGDPNPRTDFLTVSTRPLADRQAFLAEINRAAATLPAANREVMVFVHGFNTSFAEGIYRHAQMRHDFVMSGVSVSFSWPSAASVTAYATDREATLVARDALEDLLALLASSRMRRVVVVGHSMGAFLVMESLRQIAIRGRSDVLAKMQSVVLIAPDIDIEVFRRQMAVLAPEDVSVYAFTSGRDRALRLSALLRGQPERLGGITDVTTVSDLPVTIIDLSNVESRNDSLNHFKVATSPAMISVIQGMDRVQDDFFRDAAAEPGFFKTSIGRMQEVTSVVVTPR